MTGRERVLIALAHQEPDRVPLDIGACAACGINVIAYQNLLKYLEIKCKDIKLSKLSSQLAFVDELVYKKLGIDVRLIGREKDTDLIHNIKEESDHYWFVDEWGKKYKKPKDKGLYYDLVGFPLADIELKDYKWPDPTDPKRFLELKKEAEHYKEKNDAALVFSHTMGNGFLQMGAQLFGYERWFSMLALEQKKVEEYLERYLELKIEFWDHLLEQIGDMVDVVCEPDDLGTQDATFISKDMYRRFIKPRQKKLFSFIKQRADVKVLFHSDGSIYDFIPDLIETGVDILNPVQFSAAKMDTARLKQEFGKDLVFWGGGIDTQKVLPHGTKQEIEDEVKKRIDDLAPGGGFVFAAVHNIQEDVPPENIVAMLAALNKYGHYKR